MSRADERKDKPIQIPTGSRREHKSAETGAAEYIKTKQMKFCSVFLSSFRAPDMMVRGEKKLSI